MLVLPMGLKQNAYGTLVHGWVLLLIAAFGMASLLTPNQAFLVRALAAVGLATVASFASAVVSSDGIIAVRGVAVTEYTARVEQMVAGFHRATQTPEWHRMD